MVNRHRLNLLVQLLENREAKNASEYNRLRNLLVLDMTDRLSEETANQLIDLMVHQLTC